MASICVLLILTVTIMSIGSAKTGDFSTVHCQKETLGQYGGQSLLECVVKTPPDTEIDSFTWKKDSRTLLSVTDRVTTVQAPGYLFVTPSSWNGTNMTVSLRIINTEVEHEGLYEVMVLTDRGVCKDSTTLHATAKYMKPTIHSNPEAMNLTCKSDGGYPEGTLRWFGGNEELTASQMKASQGENGLFQLSSTLSLREGSSVSTYTCRVFNASGGREQETLFPVPDPKTAEKVEGERRKELDPPTKVVAPVVVIGSLIVGLLIAVMLYIRRSQTARRQSTAPLTGTSIFGQTIASALVSTLSLS
uniref:Ig-like domain-containing protein n=1 Tax=Gasterosteus aculeatus aculeatus TaxID=481459 RepID=A0AAQ4RFK3_GASAC